MIISATDGGCWSQAVGASDASTSGTTSDQLASTVAPHAGTGVYAINIFGP